MELGTSDPVSLAKKLSEISKPVDNELMVSGNFYAAVRILERLDQRTSKNETVSKEEVDSFMKVGVPSFYHATPGNNLRKRIKKDVCTIYITYHNI